MYLGLAFLMIIVAVSIAVYVGKKERKKQEEKAAHIKERSARTLPDIKLSAEELKAEAEARRLFLRAQDEKIRQELDQQV